MSKKAKLEITEFDFDDDIFSDIIILGIRAPSIHLHQMAHLLNTNFSWALQCDPNKPEHKEGFGMLSSILLEDHINLFLLENISESIWINTKTYIDYFLIIKGDVEVFPSEKIREKLEEIPSIFSATTIQTESYDELKDFILDYSSFS